MVETRATKTRKTDTPSTSRIGRRERNKQEKLDRILAAARDLFAAKGFSETTTQEIAERADIGTGTLFLYAKTKEDLLIMVFHEEMAETSRAAFRRTTPDTPLIDQLMQVFNSMIAYHNRDLPLARALIREITVLSRPERREDVRSLMRGIYGGIADLLAATQKKEKLRTDLDLMMVAENFFGIYYLSLVGWLGGQTTKQHFVKRLRIKLMITIEGLIERNAGTASASKSRSVQKIR